MRFVAAICLALICVSSYAGPTDIDDPDTLKYLRDVHDTLGAASRAITACANGGGERRACACEHKDLVEQFHMAIDALLKAHPEVRNYSTVNYRGADGGTIAQNIPALIRQAENPPNCPQ